MKKYLSTGVYIFSLLTLVCYILFALRPDLSFSIYTTRIFPGISSVLNFTSTGWTAIAWLILIFTYFKYRKVSDVHKSLVRWGKFLVEPLLWIIILYFWLWGFNYLSPRPENFMFKEEMSVPKSELLEALQHQTIRVNSLRDSLDSDLIKDKTRFSKTEVQNWQEKVDNAIRQYRYKSNHEIDLCEARPMGLLLRFGAAGLYNFVLARPTIDPGLHILQMPNTSLHEITHAYGVANEASANFIAYIAGNESNDLITKYSVNLSFWRTLRMACMDADSATTAMITSFLNPSVRRDIREIRKQMERYPDWLPQLRDNFYDFFLKSQGIEEGVESYSMYVPLVLRWEKEKKLKIPSKI
ncbi:MAG: DUF3810 family protein [Saprospiraceae bacterium]|nr:DUF3810 family protein [Saprospiraceae bacterium]